LKRLDFIRGLTDAGCLFVPHGGNHDVYRNPRNGKQAPVPRHSEIKPTLAELIRKQLGL
jgi:mRNA interferase HicA